MPNDPDFHDCAATWLDGTGDDGQHRVLREILRDSPDAAGEFASLARTEAALQLSVLTRADLLQHARTLIEPALYSRMRRLARRPVFRWSAAAALIVAGVLWLILRDDRAADEQQKQSKRRIASDARHALPTIAQSAVAADHLPPADKEFSARMGKFIVPEFRATRIPLAAAIDALGKNIAAIDPAAQPEFSIAAEVPDDITVNLHLKYQPVAVLVDLIAIQTRTKFSVSGKGYAVIPESRAPMTDEPVWTLHPFAAINQFLQRQGLERVQARIPEVSADVIDAALGERPSVQDTAPTDTNPTSVSVNGTDRLHKLLQRVTSAEAGTPPGTWGWSIKVVELASTAARERFEKRVPNPVVRMVFDEDEFQTLTRELSNLEGVNLLTLPPFTPVPGKVDEWLAGTESPDPINDPENWTGIRCRIQNRPAGDAGGQFRADVNVRDPGMNSMVQSETTEIKDGETMLVCINPTFLTKAPMVFLTGHRDPSKVESPYGIPVVGKSGFVYSPYAEDKGMVDVEGLKRGTRVQCPYTQKHFRVP